VSSRQAQRFVVMTMWSLVGAFVLVGLLFLITPDGVLHRLQQLGDQLGSFAAPPRSQEKLWLGLAVAYMTVISGIAIVVATDVARHRPMLLVLAAGKAVSSLTCLVYFIDRNVFAYLANFVVDGSLVGVALLCWLLAGRVRGGLSSAAAAAPD
jgi:hypothetical protein